MKKAIIYIAAVLFSVIGFGQNVNPNATENYIHKITYKDPYTQTNVGNANVQSKIETISYFDGLGRPKQTIAVNAGGNKTKNNLTPWKGNWVEGSGSAPMFNRNGGSHENNRVIGTDPHGNASLLWKCGSDTTNDADGGWNTSLMSIDNTVGYRYTVWVKRTGSQNGKTYHGTKYVNYLNGNPNSNPYFWAGDLPQLDEWYLMVGIVHPHDYTGSDTNISGIYDVNGNKVIDAPNEFKWQSTAHTSYFRSYLYYATDLNTEQYFYNPITQKLDGTESSVEDIINDLQYADVVSHMEYDDYGRQTKDYLPFSSANNNGRIIENAKDKIHERYFEKFPDDFPGITDAMSTNPYSEKLLESSPLNRVRQQAAPGKDWALGNHVIEFVYQTNIYTEVRNYGVNLSFANNTYSPTLVMNGYYAANSLYKTITKDENHNGTSSKDHTTEEFKDKQGRVVLKRTYNNEIKHDTYYVYDDYGNLSYVLPPKADADTSTPNSTKLNDLCYQYKYDHRNRLVEKKIPGKGWEYIVYNKLDQPILTQDAVQRAKPTKEWLFTKYDAFGRVVYTGLYKDNNARESVQNSADASSSVSESYNSVYVPGTLFYYTNNAFPTNIPYYDVYTLNYYNDYVYWNGDTHNPAQNIYGEAINTNAKGLLATTKVKVLGISDTFVTTITGYDNKNRPIYVYVKNDLSQTTDVVHSKLGFRGLVEETTSVHTKGGVTTTVKDFYTYDHVGKVLTHKQQINSEEVEVIVQNNYDDLGQLVSKGVGGKTDKGRLQQVDYDYNIRGWLKGINDIESLGSDLFSFGINYNTIKYHTSNDKKLYNGNISETEWKTANSDNSLKWYKYSYDDLNRITGAIDNSTNMDYRLNNVTYDKNGNILGLSRRGQNNITATSFGWMDVLTYEYNSGNKLTKVSDNGPGYGFKDGTNTGNDYNYDTNGNMIADANKGITSIIYNHLNLPKLINFNDDSQIEYMYSADGIKLLKDVSDETNNTNTQTKYAGNFIYENTGGSDTLKFFSQPEGYVEPDTGGEYKYIYQYKDHLGNIRLSYQGEDGGFNSILDSDFEDGYGGWEHNGTPTTELIDGRLKVNVMTAWEGLKHYLSDYPTASGEQFKVKLDFDKGNTIAPVRLYFQELDVNGGHLRWRTLNGNLTTGTYEYDFTTFSNTNKLVLRIDKYNSYTTDETYFFVDNISVTQGSLDIVEENNYYPFGLKHKGYNNVINGTDHPYGFQEQEEQDELGLGWVSFKWRNADPAIGRFFGIDPLAEKFTYNSPYAFSENKVISHFELEGLEAVIAITLGKDVEYRGDILQQANSDVLHTNIRSGGVNSLVDALQAGSASDPNGIGFAAIWGHGVPGKIYGGGFSSGTSVRNSDLSVLNDAIKNGDISFADNSLIYLGNCNSGTCRSGDTRSFAAELSKITGSTVIGGNDQVGVGADGSQIENFSSMIYWMYNPRNDSFLSFEDGIEVNNLGGSVDVIQLMNAAIRMTNPASTVNSGLTPSGVATPTPVAPSSTAFQANANTGETGDFNTDPFRRFRN